MYRPAACERSRAWAAFAVDGELSLLERRLLDAHVARCPECAQFASDVVDVTRALRAQPLDQPRTAMVAPARGRRSGRTRNVRAVGTTAALAAVAVGAFSMGSLSSSDAPRIAPVKPVIVDGAVATAAQAEPAELRAFRQALLLEDTGATPAPVERTGPQPL